MRKMKIGLLPLFIKLYDDIARDNYRNNLEPFYATLVRKFESRGVEVVTSDFCRLKEEFAQTVKKFEDANVDCIVTIHTAYSPSLESVEALTGTSLPIVVLDTTLDYDFSDKQEQKQISFNHGIHGVMDMCNLLKRGGKEYAIAAGHYENSDVIDRCVGFVKAAAAVKALRGSRVGTIGGSFDGMGDFLVADEEIKNTFGAEVVYGKTQEVAAIAASVTDEEIAEEIASYKNDFEQIGPASDEALKNTARCCLAVRKWIEKNDLNAFTVNFLKIGNSAGINVMPFIEACRSMARGIGYAGEGDVLTAAIVGALLQSFKETSFVEIFCPDWKGNTLLISHMGEMNYNLCAGRPEMKEINFIFGQDAENPVVAYGCYKPGKAVFANIFRDEKGFCLLSAPVEMIGETTDNFKGKIRGWFKPEMPIGEFLEKISYAGVTHHSLMIYGAEVEQIEYFGRLLGLNIVK